MKNQRKGLKETEGEIQKQLKVRHLGHVRWSSARSGRKVLFIRWFPLHLQVLSQLKQERDHLKEELQDVIEEKVKENMDMVLMRTEALMKERDRVMTQRIREEKEELEKNLKRLQKICSLFSHNRR